MSHARSPLVLARSASPRAMAKPSARRQFIFQFPAIKGRRCDIYLSTSYCDGVADQPTRWPCNHRSDTYCCKTLYDAGFNTRYSPGQAPENTVNRTSGKVNAIGCCRPYVSPLRCAAIATGFPYARADKRNTVDALSSAPNHELLGLSYACWHSLFFEINLCQDHL